MTSRSSMAQVPCVSTTRRVRLNVAEECATPFKDGIIFDAKQLLADLAAMVAAQKFERGITELPDIPWAAGEGVPIRGGVRR